MTVSPRRLLLDLAVKVEDVSANLFWKACYPKLTVDPNWTLDQKLAALAVWHHKLCKRRLFNGTVLIARKGEVLFHKKCGNRDVEGKEPITDRSAFNLASVSKQFTAMGILLLAYEHRLDIDDPLSKWIPELDAPAVTIRHMLHHTAGLTDFIDLAEQHWDTDRTLTFSDLLALFQRHKPIQSFSPGEKFEYSNTGYVLLGLIIERASGMPHEAFMREHIFRPLDMNDSGAFNKLSAVDALPERVFGFRRRYRFFGKRIADDLNFVDGTTGDGGIYASARDLLKWDRGLNNGLLLSEQVYAEAYTSGRTNDGEATDYGFGWNLYSDGSVGHGGSWVGFQSGIYRNSRQELLLVVLDNSSNEGFHDVTQALVDFVFFGSL